MTKTKTAAPDRKASELKSGVNSSNDYTYGTGWWMTIDYFLDSCFRRNDELCIISTVGRHGLPYRQVDICRCEAPDPRQTSKGAHTEGKLQSKHTFSFEFWVFSFESRNEDCRSRLQLFRNDPLLYVKGVVLSLFRVKLATPPLLRTKLEALPRQKSK